MSEKNKTHKKNMRRGKKFLVTEEQKWFMKCDAKKA